MASQGLGVLAANADAFRKLVDAGLLDRALAARSAGAAGFRNVLVNGYADVDDAPVVANLDHLEHLRSYVQAMVALLDLGGDAETR